jgi:hypothetical protein
LLEPLTRERENGLETALYRENLGLCGADKESGPPHEGRCEDVVEHTDKARIDLTIAVVAVLLMNAPHVVGQLFQVVFFVDDEPYSTLD